MSAKAKAQDYTVEDLLREQSKREDIAFSYGAILLWLAIVASTAVALTAKQFDVNTWPETISSLIYNNQTTYGLAFYGMALTAGIFIVLSYRFTYSSAGGDDWGTTARLWRHYGLSASFLLLVLIPSNTPHDAPTDQIIIASFHYVFALILFIVYPCSELYLYYYNTTRSGWMKMRWVIATLVVALTFVAVRISIAALDWQNKNISNALTLSCFCLEVVAIAMLTVVAWVAPFTYSDDDDTAKQ